MGQNELKNILIPSHWRMTTWTTFSNLPHIYRSKRDSHTKN